MVLPPAGAAHEVLAVQLKACSAFHAITNTNRKIWLSLHFACEVLAGSSMGNACRLDQCDACQSTCHLTALTSEHSANPGGCGGKPLQVALRNKNDNVRPTMEPLCQEGDHTEELKACRVKTFEQ